MSLLRELNLWAVEYSGVLAFLLIGLLVSAAAIFLRLNANLRKVIRRYNNLMKGVDQANLEALVAQQVELARQHDARLSEVEEACRRLSVQANGSLQRVGMVKYNAFDGVGGNQSFSLALLDASGTGFVLSSLFGRNESALYCKAVNAGQPAVAASREEEEAIRLAMAGGKTE